jgi:transcriptional repressor of cell division inhibition gene dicB
MKTETAIQHAGGVKALATLLGVTVSAISQWEGDVPPARQLQLQKLTKGKLKADPDCLARLLEPKRKSAADKAKAAA